MPPQIEKKEFTVVLRGRSAAIFKKGEYLQIDGYPSTIGAVNIAIKSRQITVSENDERPGHIWIEVKGAGNSLDEVIVPFANAGIALLPAIALSSNAAILDPDVELAFESTQHAQERDYFQQYIPPETNELHFYRQIKPEATLEIVNAINSSEEAERLHRAANQYRLALDSWRLGRETLSLSHLWMAVEALTKSRIRAEHKRAGVNNDGDLANKMGIDVKKTRCHHKT